MHMDINSSELALTIPIECMQLKMLDSISGCIASWPVVIILVHHNTFLRISHNHVIDVTLKIVISLYV